MKKKYCTLCEKEKSLESFCKNRVSHDGRCSVCKECQKKKRKKNKDVWHYSTYFSHDLNI